MKERKTKTKALAKKKQARRERKPGFPSLERMECFKEFHEMVVSGETPEEIARWLQEEKGERTDASRGAVGRQIYRYRNSLPAHENPSVEVPQHLTKRLNEYANDVNELHMLNKLFQIQMERVLAGRSVEEKLNMLNKNLWREVEQAKDILVKIGQMKVTLGVYEGAATERFAFSGTVKHKGVIGEFSAEERERLGRIADAFFQRVLETDSIQEAEYELLESGE